MRELPFPRHIPLYGHPPGGKRIANCGAFHIFVDMAMFPALNADAILIPPTGDVTTTLCPSTAFAALPGFFRKKSGKALAMSIWNASPLLNMWAQLWAPFLLVAKNATPHSTRRAPFSAREPPMPPLNQFAQPQPSSVDAIISQDATLENRRGNLSPPELAPSSGNSCLVALTTLSISFGLGRETWMHQFKYGFKIIGRLSQKECLPTRPKEQLKQEENPQEIPESKAARFTDSATKSGHKGDQIIRNESSGKIEKCRTPPTPPFPTQGRISRLSIL